MVDDSATPEKDATDEGQLSEDDIESVVGGIGDIGVGGIGEAIGVLGEAG